MQTKTLFRVKRYIIKLELGWGVVSIQKRLGTYSAEPAVLGVYWFSCTLDLPAIARRDVRFRINFRDNFGFCPLVFPIFIFITLCTISLCTVTKVTKSRQSIFLANHNRIITLVYTHYTRTVYYETRYYEKRRSLATQRTARVPAAAGRPVAGRACNTASPNATHLSKQSARAQS